MTTPQDAQNAINANIVTNNQGKITAQVLNGVLTTIVSAITTVSVSLALYAPLASPTFTGTSTVNGPLALVDPATGDGIEQGATGAVGAKIGNLPNNISSIEIAHLLPGIAGAGATMLCERATPHTTRPVSCRIVASGEGQVTLGGGDGIYGAFLPPGGPVAAFVTFTPSLVSAPSPNIAFMGVANTLGAGGSLAINVPTAVALGPSSLANGTGSIAAGKSVQSYGVGSFAAGNNAYDWIMSGARVYMSAIASDGHLGGNQIWEQTLQSKMTGSSAVRMSIDGSTSYLGGQSVPLLNATQTSSFGMHGTFKIDAECTDLTTGDSAIWLVSGSFVNIANPLRLPYTSGTGYPVSSDASLSTMTLTVSADTTNNNLNITPTPPGGNSHTISCTASARWMEKIG